MRLSLSVGSIEIVVSFWGVWSPTWHAGPFECSNVLVTSPTITFRFAPTETGTVLNEAGPAAEVAVTADRAGPRAVTTPDRGGCCRCPVRLAAIDGAAIRATARTTASNSDSRFILHLLSLGPPAPGAGAGLFHAFYLGARPPANPILGCGTRKYSLAWLLRSFGGATAAWPWPLWWRTKGDEAPPGQVARGSGSRAGWRPMGCGGRVMIGGLLA